MTLPGNKWKLAAILLLLGLSFSILGILTMAEFHEEIGEPFLAHVDLAGMRIIHAHDTPGLTRTALALSWIGSPVTLVPILSVAMVVLWYRRFRRDAVILFVAMGGAGAIDSALKLHFRRVRPDVPWALVTEHSFSFPSGHSVGAVVLYGIATYLAWNHLRGFRQRALVITAALLLIAGIGASRVYLGVHYPTDVAAGYMVGLFWLVPIIGTNEYINRAEGRRAPDDQTLPPIADPWIPSPD